MAILIGNWLFPQQQLVAWWFFHQIIVTRQRTELTADIRRYVRSRRWRWWSSRRSPSSSPPCPSWPRRSTSSSSTTRPRPSTGSPFMRGGFVFHLANMENAKCRTINSFWGKATQVGDRDPRSENRRHHHHVVLHDRSAAHRSINERQEFISLFQGELKNQK